MLGPGGHEAESDGKDTVFPVLKISCPQDTASVWIMDFCTIPGAILHIIVRSTSLPSYFAPFQALVKSPCCLASFWLIWISLITLQPHGLDWRAVWFFAVSFKSVFISLLQWSYNCFPDNESFCRKDTRNWIWILPHLIFLSGKHFPSRESELC